MKSFSAKQNPVITGTLFLTAAGFLSRFLGFFYRIFLSRAIGAEGLGIYQMIFPIHGIAFALCAGPIQTSISRLAAADPKKGKLLFRTGLSISMALSLLLMALIRSFPSPLATYVLLEPRCAPLLPVMALSIPFSAIHACICGYYYGLKKTAVPAFSQLTEQCIRIGAVFFIAHICTVNQIPISVSLAVWGLLIGEAASAIFSFLAYTFSVGHPRSTNSSNSSRCSGHPHTHEETLDNGRSNPCEKKHIALIHSLLAMALPLMGNRLILSCLQSLESIFVPNRLIQSGLTSFQALSLYGILTGMALPFILFPSAITNSMAVILLPTVSEAQAAGNQAKIARTISMALRYSLYMGILCIGLFTLFGPALGHTVYRSRQAGYFIRTLSWLCPFLYLSTTMGSILNGLGKTGTVFLHHAVSMLVTLAIVLFAIPKFGMPAYLFALLTSELLLALLHIRSLSKEVSFFLPASQGIVIPSLCLITAFFLLKAAEPFLAPLCALFPADFLGIMARAALFSLLYGAGLLVFHQKRHSIAE